MSINVLLIIIFIYYTGYVTIKDSKYIKIYSVNPLYLIFSNINRYLQEISKSKYLMLVPINKSKAKIKEYEELWSKIRELVRSITKSLDYDEKYMKIKFNWDDELPLNKIIEISKIIIVIRAVLHENNKYKFSYIF